MSKSLEQEPQRAATVVPTAELNSQASFWHRHALTLGAIAAALTARIVFVLYTHRVWEDALITITHARNAARGLGLTHHFGEGRIHGFTSALSVLIPLAGEWMWPDSSMLSLRIAALIATVATLWFAAGIARELKLSPWPTAAILGYLALDYNQILFGMAGMETQVAMAVLLAGIYSVMRGSVVGSGICLGLTLLTRPDFVLWAAPAAFVLLIRDWRAGLKAIGIGAAVVLPWLVFTTWYYGSPVPHTILAKSAALTDRPVWSAPWQTWLRFLFVSVVKHLAALVRYAAPLFEDELVVVERSPAWQRSLLLGGVAFWFLAALGFWRTWKKWTWWSALGFLLVFMLYRLLCVQHPYYFTWHIVPFIGLAAILAAAGLEQLGQRWPRAKPIGAVLFVAAFGVHFIWSLPLNRRLADLEQSVRKPLGQYIATEVKRGEGLISESAGFVGYYGQAMLYDFPGLTSERAYEALRRLPPGEQSRSMPALIHELQPEWLVLRPAEARNLETVYPELWNSYELDRRFSSSADDQDATYGYFTYGGITIYTIDTDFSLMRRKPGIARVP